MTTWVARPAVAPALAPPRPGPRSPSAAVRLAQLALWTMPVLRPAGPAGLALPDLFMVACLVTAVVAAHRRRQPFPVPYAWGVGLMVTGGALAMVASADVVIGHGLLSLGQDAYLLGWAAALAYLGREAGVTRRLVRTWAAAAVAHAVVFDAAWLGGFALLSGTTATQGARGSYLLGDPNLAANYLVVGLFVLLASDLGGRARWRVAMAAPLLAGIALTGSNGGLLSLAVGASVAVVLGVRTRFGAVPAVISAAAIGLLAVLLATGVSMQSVQNRAAVIGGIAQDSVGRTSDSSQSRGVLLRETEQLWWEHGLLGVGPGQTKPVLAAEHAPYVKEAHDDYLGTMVERGLLGAAGLALLIASATVRAARAVPLRWLSPAGTRWREPRPELIVAAGAVLLTAAAVYEVLHFRQTWTLLGILAALAAVDPRRARPLPRPPLPAGPRPVPPGPPPAAPPPG